MMRGLIFVLAGSLSTAAMAVPAAVPAPAVAAKPSAAAAVKPAAGKISVPVLKRVAMSPEGNKIVQQIAAVPEPRLQQIQTEVQGLLQQKAQFLTGNPIDVGKLEALLRREAALVSEFRTRQDDRLLMIMRALSESDRIAFLQSRAQVSRPPAPAAAPQGAKPAVSTPPPAAQR